MLTVEAKKRDIEERIRRVEMLGQCACPKCKVPYVRTKFYRPYFICKSCGHRWSENPTIDALGTFLSDLHTRYPWDWFATLTFAREGMTWAGGQYWFERYLGDAGRAGAVMPYAFRADELGPLYGRYHLHALVGNVSHLQIYCGERLSKGVWGRPCCWIHRWPCGYARIYAYDPKRGANYYLSKYVVKAIANWDLVGFESDSLVFARKF